MDMNVANALSNETLFNEMQRRGLIDIELNWADEQARIAKQAPRPGETKTTLTG